MHSLPQILLLLLVTSYVHCCPQRCRCDVRRKVVYCHERDLQFVPHGIPRDTIELRLQGNKIVDSPLTLQNLRHLTQLRRLDLHRNKLTSFPKHLPSSLEQIDLNSNQIKFISHESLQTMRNLRELIVDNNYVTNEGLSFRAFQNLTSLVTLSMNGNLMTSLPANLPSSLRHIFMKKNRIDVIGSGVTRSLGGLVTLDLSENLLGSKVNSGDFFWLSELKSLNLIGNMLRHVPSNLPSNLRQLELARNEIKYVAIGELNPGLHVLDFSSNKLESIEEGVFDALPLLVRISLHDNPWRCDCYLTYLKQWLTITLPLVTSESNVRCATPQVFRDVTIRSIDIEALRCDVIESSSIVVENVTSSSVHVTFEGSRVSDPSYLDYFIFYGILECRNCSNLDTSQSALALIAARSDVMIASSLEIEELAADTDYVICARTSYQRIVDVTLKSCIIVRTEPVVLMSVSGGARSPLPTWAIVGISALLFGVAIVTTLLALWRFYTNKHKLRHRRYCSHFSRASIVSRSMENIHQVHIKQYKGSDVKRSISTTTLDARNEFDVTILVRGQEFVTSPPSLDSAVTSTNNTDVFTNSLHRQHYDVTTDNERLSWYSSNLTDLDDTGVYV